MSNSNSLPWWLDNHAIRNVSEQIAGMNNPSAPQIDYSPWRRPDNSSLQNSPAYKNFLNRLMTPRTGFIETRPNPGSLGIPASELKKEVIPASSAPEAISIDSQRSIPKPYRTKELRQFAHNKYFLPGASKEQGVIADYPVKSTERIAQLTDAERAEAYEELRKLKAAGYSTRIHNIKPIYDEIAAKLSNTPQLAENDILPYKSDATLDPVAYENAKLGHDPVSDQAYTSGSGTASAMATVTNNSYRSQPVISAAPQPQPTNVPATNSTNLEQPPTPAEPPATPAPAPAPTPAEQAETRTEVKHPLSKSQLTAPKYGYTMQDLNGLTAQDFAKYKTRSGRNRYNTNSIADRMAVQMIRNGENPNSPEFMRKLNQNLKNMGFSRTRNARKANQQLVNLGYKRIK